AAAHGARRAGTRGGVAVRGGRVRVAIRAPAVCQPPYGVRHRAAGRAGAAAARVALGVGCAAMGRRLLVLVLLVSLFGALPFALARADVCAEPGQEFKSVPWQQQMLAPSRVWPLTRGGGTTVAVLDSGVDAAHPRLAGRVSPGFDALAGSGAANTDCLG